MVKYIKISLCIILTLSISRLIPHPPNFTNLIALSFYVPALIGLNFIPALLLSFFVTDLIIGLHKLTFFTWGSVIIIGLISHYFKKNIYTRFSGALIGSLIFFILTNFGVWILGLNEYAYNFEGLIMCYILAIPFYGNTFSDNFIFFDNRINLYNLQNK